MPKGYIIAHIDVTNPDGYPEYVRHTTPLMGRLGGTFIVRGGQNEVVEGSSGNRHVVIEFPSYAEALAAYKHPEYQRVADIRRANSDSTFIVVEGAP